MIKLNILKRVLGEEINYIVFKSAKYLHSVISDFFLDIEVALKDLFEVDLRSNPEKLFIFLFYKIIGKDLMLSKIRGFIPFLIKIKKRIF